MDQRVRSYQASSILSLQRQAVLAALLLANAAVPGLSQDTNHQQGIFLKNPTPRDPDLEQKYAVNPTSVGMVDHASVVLNVERQELISHASKDLATLASALKGSLQRHAQGSYEPEVKVATLMESLAKNINGALRAGIADRHVPASAKQDEEEVEKAAAPVTDPTEARRLRLQTTSERLVVLTQALQTDVTSTGVNMLSTSALAHSAEIEVLAKDLKQTLKKTPRG